jgi:hypothetical protein
LDQHHDRAGDQDEERRAEGEPEDDSDHDDPDNTGELFRVPRHDARLPTTSPP